MKDLGYIADCSVTPKISWKNMPGSPGVGGPDFTNKTPKPYFLDESKNLLEVPMTIVYTGILTNDDNFFGKMINKLPESFIKSVFNKIFFGKKWLRIFPNSNENHWIKIYKAVEINNLGVLEFMIHSTELALGASKQTKTKDQVEFTFDQLDKLFAYLKKQEVAGMSLSDFTRYYQSNH